jgi:hypothetical protein
MPYPSPTVAGTHGHHSNAKREGVLSDFVPFYGALLPTPFNTVTSKDVRLSGTKVSDAVFSFGVEKHSSRLLLQ